MSGMRGMKAKISMTCAYMRAASAYYVPSLPRTMLSSPREGSSRLESNSARGSGDDDRHGTTTRLLLLVVNAHGMTSCIERCNIIKFRKMSTYNSAEHHIDEYGVPRVDGVEDADTAACHHGRNGGVHADRPHQ